MPNELNIALANSGLTVTAQRYQSGAAVGSAISLTEILSTGVYTGNMTGSAGTYQLAFISAGKNVGSGQIAWDGTNEVASSAPTAADNASAVWAAASRTLTSASGPIAVQIRQEMDSNSTQLTAIKGKTDNLPAAPAAVSNIPTADQNAAAVWNKPTTELTITGSIGERAKNQSTVSTTGAQLAAALS